MKLSDTQRVILSKASQHDAGLVTPPPGLPAAARNAVFRSMLKRGLVMEIRATREYAGLAWREDEDSRSMVLTITEEGMRAIGIDPDEGKPGEPDACGLEGSVPGTPAEEPTMEIEAGFDPLTGTAGAASLPVPHEDGMGGNATFGDAQGADAPAGDDTTTDGAEPGHAPPDAQDEGDDEPEDDRPRHERLGVDDGLIHERDAPAALAEELAMLDESVEEDARTRRGLRAATVAFLAAWDAGHRDPILATVEGLRTALAGKPARTPRAPRPAGEPRAPREGSKQETVLALLRRAEGASGPQMAEATGWAPHTIRGFLAGLKKKGIDVQVKERVRMVGPNKEGAKGSYTVYQVAG